MKTDFEAFDFDDSSTKKLSWKSSAQPAPKSMPGFARLGFKKQSSLQTDFELIENWWFQKRKLDFPMIKNFGERVRESQKVLIQ